MTNSKKIGQKGEYYAKNYLKSQGLIFITANFFTRYGEIDLIFCDKQSVYFFEVKTRRGRTFGYPEEAVTNKKLAKIKRTIPAFFQAHPRYGNLSPLIRVVSVVLSPDGDKLQRLEIFNVA